MSKYRCVHGHDRCGEMYAGPECPYCERVTPRKKASDYPFCDTSKCPHWHGYCRRDPACND